MLTRSRVKVWTIMKRRRRRGGGGSRTFGCCPQGQSGFDFKACNSPQAFNQNLKVCTCTAAHNCAKKVQYSPVTQSFRSEIVLKWQTDFRTEPWHLDKEKLGLELNLELKFVQELS